MWGWGERDDLGGFCVPWSQIEGSPDQGENNRDGGNLVIASMWLKGDMMQILGLGHWVGA